MGDLCDSSCASFPGCLNRFPRFHRIPSASNILRIPRPLQHVTTLRFSEFKGSASVNSLLGQDDVTLVDLAFASRCLGVFEFAKRLNLHVVVKKEQHISVSKCCEMSWVMTWHHKNQVRRTPVMNSCLSFAYSSKKHFESDGPKT